MGVEGVEGRGRWLDIDSLMVSDLSIVFYFLNVN